jgi:hypothetical protein
VSGDGAVADGHEGRLPGVQLHELFNHRLRDGVSYRLVITGLVFFAVWVPIIWATGLWSVGNPTPAMLASILPPALGTMAATRIDESGRMAMVTAWDRVLARRSSRRRPVRNPLVPEAAVTRPALVIAPGRQATELRALGDPPPVRKLWTDTYRGSAHRAARKASTNGSEGLG